MIILDTNVISALMRSVPERPVIAWLDDQLSESIWTTSICVFEIAYGLHCLPKGGRQKSFQEAFDLALYEDLGGRVLEFDSTSANEAALIIAAHLRAKGRPIEVRDVLIAGIVAARSGTLATRNTKHFIDTKIPLVDPWETEPV